MKFSLIIPARMQSSRFPGKPLAKIFGKELIQIVWENCAQAFGAEKVWVATDSAEIFEYCKKINAQVSLTSPSCLTGTDRVAEMAKKLDFDWFLNVQGDEPMISAAHLIDFLTQVEANQSSKLEYDVYCGMSVGKQNEFNDVSVPKVVTSLANELLYISRAGIPSSKDKVLPGKFFKQVCVYAFSKRSLLEFAKLDDKTPVERSEDIEILRFLELGMKVKMILMQGNFVAVDHPQDIGKVELAIKDGSKQKGQEPL